MTLGELSYLSCVPSGVEHQRLRTDWVTKDVVH